MNNGEYILEMKDISKTFPGVKALNKVNLKLKKGEVLALCGENGAGKSTLMKILCGVYTPDTDSGDIIYNGKKVSFKRTIDAKNEGIIMIFQELSLVTDLSVAENIFLGSLPMKSGVIDWKKLYADTKKILLELGCDFSPKTPIANLPISQQQLVEIARGLALGAKILILDEPTSSLTDREKDSLFRIVRMLKDKGVGVIYISHKMDEIFEITDRVSVFRDGCNTGEFITKEIVLDDIVKSMIGRTLDDYYHKSNAIPGEEVLRVENLTKKGMYENISFNVRKGEVVGLYGLVGAGRSEIVETIFGVRRPDKGDIYLNGKKAHIKNTVQAVKHRIGLVPENRKEQGLILEMSCRENIMLSKLPWLKKGLWVDKKASYRIYNDYKEKLSISSPSSEQKIVNLSGGNQQKVILGKWLCMDPQLLILDEPTRGIDVGSKSEIHKLIAGLAEDGMAIIVISSEMPEIIGVSNRLFTISNGELTGELEGEEINEQAVMKAITMH